MRIEPDPKKCTLDSTRPQQDKWRDEDGWIDIKAVDKERFNYLLLEEDVPFIKPSDRLRLLLEADLAKKLKMPGYNYLKSEVWRTIFREVGQLVAPEGGIIPEAYAAYNANKELEAMCRKHKNSDLELAKKEAQRTKRASQERLIYKKGFLGMGKGLLFEKLKEALPETDLSGIEISPFNVREDEYGYNPNKKTENGRGYIFADPMVAEAILDAAREKKIQVTSGNNNTLRHQTIEIERKPELERAAW